MARCRLGFAGRDSVLFYVNFTGLLHLARCRRKSFALPQARLERGDCGGKPIRRARPRTQHEIFGYEEPQPVRCPDTQISVAVEARRLRSAPEEGKPWVSSARRNERDTSGASL